MKNLVVSKGSSKACGVRGSGYGDGRGSRRAECLSGRALQSLGERGEREVVAQRTESADHAPGCERDERLLIDRLAAVDVGQMDLDDRSLGGLQRVEQCDGAERVAGGIDDDP